MEEGATKPKNEGGFQTWKRQASKQAKKQKPESPLELLEGTQPLNTLILVPILGSDL